MFGRKAIEGFRHEGIHTDYIIKDKELSSGIALIFVAENGENSIAVASGANSRLSPDDVERAKKAIKTADILLLQLEIPLETVRAAARLAAASGIRVILNPAPAQPLDEDLIKQISVLTPNENEAEQLTGIAIKTDKDVAKAAKALLSQGTGAVVITIGPKGAYAAARGLAKIVPGFRVRAVDTTAAGDVFNGALAVALAEKKSLIEAARFANAAAAFSVTKMGAQPSIPFRPQIEAFLKG
jgi:ribokinase